MRLALEKKNEKILDKLLWMLEHFRGDGVEVLMDQVITKKANPEYTEQYIKENWQELTSKGLSGYEGEYLGSDQYKLDRGNYLMDKYK